MNSYPICFELYHKFKNKGIFDEREHIKIDFKNGLFAHYVKIPVFNKDHMARASGIDFDFEKAFIKAIMEACEWYTHCYTNCFDKTYLQNEIKGKKILESNSVNLFDELDSNNLKKIQYSSTVDYFNQKITYISSQLVYGNYFYFDKPEEEPLLRIPISTGLAAHTNKQASLLKSLLEVFERDNYTLYMYNKQSPNTINFQTNDKLNTIKHYLKTQGYELYFFDFTYDSPAKVIGSLIKNRDRKWLRMGISSGWDIEECLYHSFFEAYKQIFPIKHIENDRLFHRNSLYQNMQKTSSLWENQDYWSKLDFLFKGKQSEIDSYKTNQKIFDTNKMLLTINTFLKHNQYEVFIKKFNNIFSNKIFVQKLIIPKMIPLYVNKDMNIAKMERNMIFINNKIGEKLMFPVPFL